MTALDQKKRRVLLKVSGESLSGSKGFGYDPDTLEGFAAQIAEIHESGVELAIVVGGGNLWRGIKGTKGGMERVNADYMGMLATVMNGLALKDALVKTGCATVVLSALEMPRVVPLYTQERALTALTAGQIVIFVGGTGNPYFSTDTGAALRAAEIKADVILMAKTIDGIYDSDPKVNPNAVKYDHLSFSQVLEKELKVMDSTAASMCRDNRIPLVVFDALTPGNMLRAARGEAIGTTVGGDES